MRRPLKFYLKRIFQIFASLILLFLIGTTILFFVVSAPPTQQYNEPNIVNDVTQLNPIRIDEISKPHTKEEVMSLVGGNAGPISIGGARHSMGGQIGSEHSLHLDMREFDQVISFDKHRKEITVQTGITWRKIQEYIDPYDLSVMIMQTYADFTVGGSLSVNVHGRYVGQGPIIRSVKALRVVLPNGELVEASPLVNPDIFYGCIGGYGGLGVIVEATLYLTNNCRVERHNEVMTVGSYHDYFFQHIRNDSTIIFHNADIYPDDYTDVRAVSYIKTQKSVTVEDRLKPLHSNYRLERFAMWLVSEMPGGKWIRRNWADPVLYSGEQIKWRNYEASYDAMSLEPSSRKNSTYVLQEYFVPVDRFSSFVHKMAAIFQRHRVNVINISIRHSKEDPGSLLSWASTEVFCFVVYFKQGTKPEDRNEVGVWTRELIDAAISENGSYYLPYQIYATSEQFRLAYSRSEQFFALKRKLDQTNKFRNKLWDAYYPADPYIKVSN